jgi:hypothetical protein
MFTLEDILGIDKVPPYLTPAEVAKIMRINPSTARRRCEAKQYKGAFKDGADWKIPSRFFEKQLRDAEERGEFGA